MLDSINEVCYIIDIIYIAGQHHRGRPIKCPKIEQNQELKAAITHDFDWILAYIYPLTSDQNRGKNDNKRSTPKTIS